LSQDEIPNQIQDQIRAEVQDQIRDHLAATLAGITVSRFLVAYSGGLDSTVLLHALAALRTHLPTPLHAVYVDHGLQPASRDWAAHCRAECERLGIDFTLCTVEVKRDGEGLEAAARRARYEALAAIMHEGDALLTAHHRGDQAETVLLQLLRGCGPHGLAAMLAIERFAAGWHVRPLLDLERSTLEAYAKAAGLRSIDDPSNADTQLRRNYLRHEIIPRLHQYWPQLARTLSRSAAHAAAAVKILDEVAATDLTAARGPRPEMLSIAALAALSRERSDNLLRYWLHTLEFAPPSTAHLKRLHDEVIAARDDAAPLLAWRGTEIRRYRGWLYAMAPLNTLASPDPQLALYWENLSEPLPLPDGAFLQARLTQGAGLRTDLGPLTVHFRRGGERCRPAARGVQRSLKKLLQEAGVAPWLRSHVPLIDAVIDGSVQLAAVADLCIMEGCGAGAQETGWSIEWHPPVSVRPSR
jgi:tRNA(Ile)-lysidine synthase